MTWKDLVEKINEMNSEQQHTDVTVLLKQTDEVFPACDFVSFDWTGGYAGSVPHPIKGVDQVTGVLDNGHPFIVVDF